MFFSLARVILAVPSIYKLGSFLLKASSINSIAVQSQLATKSGTKDEQRTYMRKNCHNWWDVSSECCSCLFVQNYRFEKAAPKKRYIWGKTANRSFIMERTLYHCRKKRRAKLYYQCVDLHKIYEIGWKFTRFGFSLSLAWIMDSKQLKPKSSKFTSQMIAGICYKVSTFFSSSIFKHCLKIVNCWNVLQLFIWFWFFFCSVENFFPSENELKFCVKLKQNVSVWLHF